jgi:hypothetical protein
MMFGVCSCTKIVEFGVGPSNFTALNEAKSLRYKDFCCQDIQYDFQSKYLFSVTIQGRDVAKQRERERQMFVKIQVPM